MSDPTAPRRKRTPEERAMQFVDGLHPDNTHQEALAALDALAAEQNNMVLAARNKRSVHEAMDDREQQLVVMVRGAKPEMSQTAFDKHMKAVVQQDAEMTGLRAESRTCSLDYDRAEVGARHAEFTIRVATARLEEVAGRLRFYAAVKQSPVAAANDADTTTTPGASA